MSRPNDAWTEERVARLKELVPQGLSRSQMAKDLCKLPGPGVTRNAVVGKIFRLGLEVPNAPSAPRTKMAKPKPAPRPPKPAPAPQAAPRPPKPAPAPQAARVPPKAAPAVPPPPPRAPPPQASFPEVPHPLGRYRPSPDALRLPLEALKALMVQCRAPVEDTPQILFCGLPTPAGEPWCAHCRPFMSNGKPKDKRPPVAKGMLPGGW